MTLSDFRYFRDNPDARRAVERIELGIEDGREITCPECGGDGGGDDGLGSRWDWVECRRCRGAGRVPTEVVERLEEMDEAFEDDPGRKPCPECGGKCTIMVSNTPWGVERPQPCYECDGTGEVRA